MYTQITLNPVGGSDEYHTKFLEVLEKLLGEDRVHSTARGQKAAALGSYVLKNSSNNSSCADVALLTCSKLTYIVGEKSTAKAKIGNVWINFHKLRFNTEVHHLHQQNTTLFAK